MSIIEQTVAQAITVIRGDVADLTGISASLKARLAILEAGSQPVPIVSLLASTASIAEGSGGGTKSITTTLKRTVTAGTLSVSLAFVGGTMNAADFGGSLPGTKVAVFAEGSDTATVTDTIVSDGDVEPDETFGRAIVAGAGFSIGSPAAVTYTITNDDVQATPTLSVTGARTATTAAGQGYEVGRIYGVPDGQLPSIAPNDGRFVLASKVGDYYPLVRGTTAVSSGDIAYTVSASGATAVSFVIHVTDAVSALRNNAVAWNLASFSYSEDFNCFINKITSMGRWGYQNDRTEEKDGYVVSLDQYGNPTRPNTGNSTVATQIGLMPGDYEVIHNGTVEVLLEGAAGQTVTTTSGAGTQLMKVTVGAGTVGHNVKLTYNGTGGYPSGEKGISIYRVSDKAAFQAGKLFTPEFIAEAKRSSALRFMGWNRTNGNTATDGSYRARSPQEYGEKGIPRAVMVALCNEAQCDAWYCIPAHFTDAARDADITYFRDNLAAGLKLNLELSNEPWNFNFEQFHYFDDFADNDPTFLAAYRAYKKDPSALAGTLEGYGWKVVEMSLSAQTIFASAPERLVIHANLQTGYNLFEGFADGIRAHGYQPADVFDCLSQTGYHDGGLNANRAAMRQIATSYNTAVANNDAATQTSIINRLANQLRNGGDSGFSDNGVTHASWKASITDAKAICDSYGLGMSIYEVNVVGHFNLDGIPFDAPPPLSEETGSTKAQVQARDQERNAATDADFALLKPVLTALINSNQAKAQIADTLTFARQVGMAPIGIFENYGSFSKYGPWGSKPRAGAAETGRSQAEWDFQTGAAVAPPAVPALTIAGTPPGAYVGSTRAFAPTVTGGRSRRKLSVQSGTLPPGRSIQGTLVVGAYASGAGGNTYNYTLRVSNPATGAFADLAVTETVAAQAPSFAQWRMVVTSVVGNNDTLDVAQLQPMAGGQPIAATLANTTGSSPQYDNSPTYAPAKAADGDEATFYEAASPPTPGSPVVLQFNYTAGILPDAWAYVGRSGYDFRSPKDFIIQRKESDGSWSTQHDSADFPRRTSNYRYATFNLR